MRRPLARRRCRRVRHRRAEKDFPPTRYLDAFEYVRRENFHITIHAGESFGCRRSGRRVQFAGAERLGHGVRIVDDITVRDDGSVELGRLAAFVRDRRMPLEMCPTSNVHTGARHRRRSTRSTCSAACASGSRSTPTTG